MKKAYFVLSPCMIGLACEKLITLSEDICALNFHTEYYCMHHVNCYHARAFKLGKVR